MSMLDAQKEKKVEYLELIYDLIFVYIIGRNNSLLHHLVNGFVTGEAFFTYIFCTLAIIQIWNFSTFYINLYGKNGLRDHVFLFLNMFLLYYMADGIGEGEPAHFYPFTVAWLLILVNIGVQHLIELGAHTDPAERGPLKLRAMILFAEAGLVGVHMLVHALTGISLAYLPIVFGIVTSFVLGKLNRMKPVDFAHLSERAMLYVVFTFGEMIISIASYFSGDLSFSGVYFSTMAFLIVVGLLLSYGVLYNKIIDREKVTDGSGYMMIHFFMVFALNNISVAFEFMKDEEVDLMQKTVFLVASVVLYFLFMFLTARYAKKRRSIHLKFVLILAAIGLSFVALMLLLRNVMYANIAVTVAYVFGIFILLHLEGKRQDAESSLEKQQDDTH